MHVLVVDDEENLRKSISQYLAQEGYTVSQAANGLSAQELLQNQNFDALVVDLKMPGMGGLELLGWIKTQGPELPAIMMSAFGEVGDAVEAMKRGARDYLVKPFDPEELIIRLKSVIEENRLYKKLATQPSSDSRFLTKENPQMGKLYRIIEKAAPTSSNILITGESGTGKEVMASYIHQTSMVSQGPFWPVNIGGIPESLLESELFGYEKGAFTGATERKPGLFELAGGGTLFLDEIGDMPQHLQVKLLRVLQERKIQRLGSTNPLPINVRLVSATNKNLETMVKEGTFREDLFYRLNVIHLHLPPLRERREEIPGLTTHFLEKIKSKINIEELDISVEALEVLKQYDFPGNIRELENILERAAILCEERVIHSRDLNILPTERKHEKHHPARSLKELEKEAILQALYRHENHRIKAAQELGINRRTLLNKIKEYGIEID